MPCAGCLLRAHDVQHEVDGAIDIANEAIELVVAEAAQLIVLAVHVDEPALAFVLLRQRHDSPLLEPPLQRGVVGAHELDDERDRVVPRQQ